MSGHWKKQWVDKRGAQPVADLVSKLLNPVIERRAGMTMDLIASWGEIVGEDHAEHSRPEKLNWPRKANDTDPFEPATLIVACSGANALFLQHQTTSIIASINTYFGFAAVAKIKFVQKPIEKREARRASSRKGRTKLPASKQHNLDEMLKDVEDPKLKAALEKMGQGVFSSGSFASK